MYDQLITTETHNLAKEKGFNIEICKCGVFPYCICVNEKPTQSLLQKWLREEYGIDVEIFMYNLNEYGYTTLDTKSGSYKYTLEASSNYEETLEVALQEALKLIN